MIESFTEIYLNRATSICCKQDDHYNMFSEILPQTVNKNLMVY